MERRGVLAALTPLLAGCFGGSAVSRTRTADREPTPAATATPGAAGTATATPEPTETATPEPDQGEADEAAAAGDAAEHVEAARERIGTAVDEYADSGDVAEVSVDADGFVPADVYAALVRANSSVGRAAALAATDERETTVARLEGVVAFLMRATAAQANAIEGHDALVTARDALAGGDRDAATAGEQGIATAAETVGRALSHLTSESDPADAEAVDVLDADDYRAKRDQFDAATTVLDGAADGVSSVVNGIELLSVARTRGENGNAEAAAEDAADARERLEDAASTFEDLAADLPGGVAAFEDPLASLADLAGEKASAAADVQSQYE